MPSSKVVPQMILSQTSTMARFQQPSKSPSTRSLGKQMKTMKFPDFSINALPEGSSHFMQTTNSKSEGVNREIPNEMSGVSKGSGESNDEQDAPKIDGHINVGLPQFTLQGQNRQFSTGQVRLSVKISEQFSQINSEYSQYREILNNPLLANKALLVETGDGSPKLYLES